MNIIVCVKHVPETAEEEIVIANGGKTIQTDDLVFDINECDDYAIEEAVLLKEKFGGEITVVTVGSEDADKTLRKCLARGADRAVRLTDDACEGSDAYATAKTLSRIIKNFPFDLILTGTQASDDNYSQVGVILAELLGINHATMVKKIDIQQGFVKVHRELEGGSQQVLEVNLPAVIAVQTGINEPRYVSIRAIRSAQQKDVQVIDLAYIGLNNEEVGESGSWIHVEELFSPSVDKEAEFLAGNPTEIVANIIKILKDRGLI
jgi:electron transfer flavoprotein beta subunit